MAFKRQVWRDPGDYRSGLTIAGRALGVRVEKTEAGAGLQGEAGPITDDLDVGERRGRVKESLRLCIRVK